MFGVVSNKGHDSEHDHKKTLANDRHQGLTRKVGVLRLEH